MSWGDGCRCWCSYLCSKSRFCLALRSLAMLFRFRFLYPCMHVLLFISIFHEETSALDAKRSLFCFGVKGH